MRPLALALALALAPAAARAQAAPVVVRAERADLRAARAALATHQGAIARCVGEARRVDPAPLAGLRAIDVVLTLSRAGAATSVSLTPPLTARGLSACLAEVFFGWSQGGRTGPRARVTVRVALGP